MVHLPLDLRFLSVGIHHHAALWESNGRQFGGQFGWKVSQPGQGATHAPSMVLGGGRRVHICLNPAIRQILDKLTAVHRMWPRSHQWLSLLMWQKLLTTRFLKIFKTGQVCHALAERRSPQYGAREEVASMSAPAAGRPALAPSLPRRAH